MAALQWAACRGWGKGVATHSATQASLAAGGDPARAG